MKRYVDADKMIEDTDAMRAISDAITIDGIIKYINENATADAEEVRHGEWIDTALYNGASMCSICGGWGVRDLFKHCPHCGAKMDKEKEE